VVLADLDPEYVVFDGVYDVQTLSTGENTRKIIERVPSAWCFEDVYFWAQLGDPGCYTRCS